MGCTPKHVVIIGGGASGVLMACHLLRGGGEHINITLIEKRDAIGFGTAYSTSHPHHLLNVRAANMSAFADDPDHFLRWLARETDLPAGDAPATTLFAPRGVYGSYINSLIGSYDPGRTRMRIIHGEAASVCEEPTGVTVATTTGMRLTADYAVLATGFAESALEDEFVRGPWSRPAAEGLSPDDPVLILGTGLTMVDVAISLRSSGHKGTIYALSRRGLISQCHQSCRPFNIEAADVPYGSSIAQLCRWLRNVAARAKIEAGDWRAGVDAIRPYTAELWRQLPLDSKRRFLRHARPWWDVHRHRMAPAIAADIAVARSSRQLQIIAGHVLSMRQEGHRVSVVYRPRREHHTTTLKVARIYSCMGVSTNPASSTNRAIASLMHLGRARADELGLGLDVAANDALKAADGRISDRLFAVGPITRGRYWEMIAVPDIRVQCARLAAELIDRATTVHRLPLAS